MDKTTTKRKLTAIVLSALTAFSVGTVALTAGPNLTAPVVHAAGSDLSKSNKELLKVEQQMIFTVAKDALEPFCPWIGYVTDSLEALLGLSGVLEDNDEAQGVSKEDLDSLRADLEAQLEDIKQQISNTSDALLDQIGGDIYVNGFGSELNSLHTTARGIAVQIDTIKADKTLTENEQLVEVAALIGSSSTWYNSADSFVHRLWNVSGTSTGSSGDKTYTVYYKKTTSDKWTTVQSYKANATVTIKPSAAVKYDVCVKVKDAAGKIEKKYFTVTVVKPLTNNSVLDTVTLKKGGTITVTAKATGGTTPYLYGVYYKKATAEKWTTAQSYKANAVVTITPAATVKYNVCVKVKDASGSIEKKYFDVTVTK